MIKSQEEGSHWICFLVILTHSVLKMVKTIIYRFFRRMQMHCKRSKGENLNNDDLEIYSNGSDKETSDEYDIKSSNEKASQEEQIIVNNIFVLVLPYFKLSFELH